MVLLLVLAVVALLSALLSEFAFSTLVDLRLTETFRDRTRAYYLAKGGVTVGQMLLKMDTNPGYDAYAPEELWSLGVSSYPVGEGYISVAIEDLGGKLNINSLVDASGQNPIGVSRIRFKRFFTNLGETDPEGLTAALIDWIDTHPDLDADPDNGAPGAEADYYLRQTPPVRIADRPLRSLDELALVRGFTPDLIRRIEPHVTVHGSSSDNTKINVNTASAEVLMAYAMDSGDPFITREAAEQIIERRRSQPFKTIGELIELNNIGGLQNLLRTDLTVTGGFYHIRSTAEVNDGVRRIEAFVDKSKGKLLYQKVD
ncbi:MAG TPA: type II secretion system minor pseudopilin GspK [Desulfuromonadales bacterium]|nr:type II secretion system minor pseudopilin GspK [Desulfuromonadales bacterium]